MEPDLFFEERIRLVILTLSPDGGIPQGGEWAEEFAAARPPAGADAWASEFAQQRGLPPAAMAGPSSSGAAWASEFAEARGGAGGMWADEFAGAAAEWTDEFTRIHGEEAGEDWAEAYEARRGFLFASRLVLPSLAPRSQSSLPACPGSAEE